MMFRRFPFVALVCWFLAAVIVFGITVRTALSVRRKLVISKSALKESGTSLVLFAESIPLTSRRFGVKWCLRCRNNIELKRRIGRAVENMGPIDSDFQAWLAAMI